MSPEFDQVCYICTFLGIAILLNIVLLVITLTERKNRYRRNKDGLSQLYKSRGSAAFVDADEYSPEARIQFLREKVRDENDRLDDRTQKEILNTLTALHAL